MTYKPYLDSESALIFHVDTITEVFEILRTYHKVTLTEYYTVIGLLNHGINIVSRHSHLWKVFDKYYEISINKS